MKFAKARMHWRQSIEFQTPLSVEECRQRLTMRNTPAEYDFVDNPGKFGILGPSEFTLSSPRPNSRWRTTGTQLRGQFTSNQQMTIVRLEDTTPRREYVLLILGLAGSLLAAGFYYTQDQDALFWPALLVSSSMVEVVVMLRLVRQRHFEAKGLIDAVRQLLDSEATDPGTSIEPHTR